MERPLAGARSPITFIMKLGSIFASSDDRAAAIRPRAAQCRGPAVGAVGLAALSSVNESPAVADSVVHVRAADVVVQQAIYCGPSPRAPMRLLFRISILARCRASALLPSHIGR